MGKQVKVKSLIGGTVSIADRDLNLKRTWERKGMVRSIDFDVLQEAIYLPGVEYMFKEGILGIDSMEDKIALGLEPEGATEPVNIITLDDDKMKRLMGPMPFKEFKAEVEKLPKEQVLILVDYAIEKKLIDVDKCDYLKEKTGINIISAINLNKQDKEPLKEN